ncbi:tubulin glycylase 3A-like [Chrysoperla carnea]|uniref:tubulin glycylase 3A-like n=1 Tax=Chrysoperla carnea TaxID=189513 RepID=UPI001D068744|nr:tubulin glycylase 3A-like [Chrysoperla carnea]
MVSTSYPENILYSNLLDITTINKLTGGQTIVTQGKRIPPRMNDLKKRIENALIRGKVFMASGSCNTIRRSLLLRGWLEKRPANDKKNVSNVISYTSLTSKLDTIFAEFHFEDRTDQEYYERVQADILSSLLTNVVPRFCWNCLPFTKNNMLPESTIVNRVGSSFTNKEFISQHLSELSKGNSPMIDIQYPRSYASCYSEQFVEFKDNFRLTASMSLLKTFQYRIEQHSMSSIFDENGTLDMEVIETAIKYLMEYLEFKKHEDIDKIDDSNSLTDLDNCDSFLEKCFQFVHRGKLFDKHFKLSISSLLNIIRDLLNIVEKYWPQYHLDGMLNMWLVKPAYGSRGNNIHVLSSYKDIHRLVTKPDQRTRWVIQKYVEQPLLIYNTKFDIRIWFIIKSKPFEIWVYKEYYLRFSSRPFNLSNYHESIHLTNYSVQKKYKNCYFHTDLPENNMWTSDKFQEYLQDNGYSSICCENILTKMSKCIIGCILSIESNIKRRENSFHLYGADFILDKLCSPWLIEINSYPDMSYSTEVTANLVPKCMEDLIKVIIDTRKNPAASTGNFACVFSESLVHNIDSSDQIDLRIDGKGIQIEKHMIANDVFTDSGIMILPGLEDFTTNRLCLKPIKSIDVVNNKTTKGKYATHLRRIKKTAHFIYEPNVVKKLTNKDPSRKIELQPIPSFQIGLLKNQITAAHLMCSQETFKIKNDSNGLEPRTVMEMTQHIYSDMKNNQLQLIFKNETMNLPSPFPTSKKNIRSIINKRSLVNVSKLPLHLCNPKMDLHAKNTNKTKRISKSSKLKSSQDANSTGDQNILKSEPSSQIVNEHPKPTIDSKKTAKTTSRANCVLKNILQLKNNQQVDAPKLYKEIPITKVNFDGHTLNQNIKKQNVITLRRNKLKLFYQKPDGIVN